MLSSPKLETRAIRYYAAIKREVPMEKIPDELPPLIPQVLGWIESKKMDQTGPAFFRYMRWTEDKKLEIEVGAPVSEPFKNEGEVICGNFPAGTYLTATHTGHFNGLKDAHMALERWATENNIRTKDEKTPVGQSYGARTEFYPMDPDDEPNPDKWETDLEFLVSEEK